MVLTSKTTIFILLLEAVGVIVCTAPSSTCWFQCGDWLAFLKTSLEGVEKGRKRGFAFADHVP